jgi:hypothetical protein
MVEWGFDTRLTSDIGWDMAPSVVNTSDGKVWVVWHSDRTGNEDLFYKIFDGLTWSSEIQLTNDPQSDMNPAILQASDGTIWVVWECYRNLLDEDIYYKVFNGSAWSSDISLVTESGPDKYPSIMQSSDGKIWVFWSSINPAHQDDTELFYKVYDGSAWTSDTRLTFDQVYYDEDPAALQASDGTIWVVWSKKSNAKKGDIYFKTFNGVTWSDDAQLTTDTADDLNPAVVQTFNQRIWVTWNSNRKANNMNIFYKIFDGSVWSSDTQLTNAMEDDKTPTITQLLNGTIWVAWASKRVLAQFDIYYRSGIEFHDVAVVGVTYYASHNTTTFRGEVVYIEVGVQNDGEAQEVVEVDCYANSTLIKSRITTLLSGQYYSMVFDWNTTGVRPGFYVMSAEVLPVLGELDLADNSFSNGLLEIRIKGDIVGEYNGVIQPIPDRRVDIDDFGLTIGHFGCHLPWAHPVWDSVTDVTEDGYIDIDDIMTVGMHYGQT